MQKTRNETRKNMAWLSNIIKEIRSVWECMTKLRTFKIPLSPFRLLKLKPKIFGAWGLKDQSSFESNDIYTIGKVC
jgi:hypothetical protein